MKKALSIIGVVALIAVMAVCLVACAPKDLDAAKAKMEKAGYSAMSLPNSYENAEGYVGSFMAGKGLLGKDGIIVAILFESKNDAKKFYDDTVGKDKTYENVEQSGKWVVMASTEQALKDFKK